MKIAVLFDGAGLARLGLEQAGHDCTGYELDPMKHYLSQFVGSGKSMLQDVRTVDLTQFDGVWASPPCQFLSAARTQGAPVSQFAENLLDWALALPHNPLWVENVKQMTSSLNSWGTVYNAAQFESKSRQNRNRVVGGRHNAPMLYHSYKRLFPNICPAILATEYKGGAKDGRRASRYYGRRLTLDECAYHQGFSIPQEWHTAPATFQGTKAAWNRNLYEAIGNGVPVFMAQAFGAAHV